MDQTQVRLPVDSVQCVEISHCVKTTLSDAVKCAIFKSHTTNNDGRREW